MTSISRTGLDALYRRIQQEIDDDHVGAAQVAIGLGGDVVATRSFGAANDDSRFVIFSATKATVAMALLPHLADGTLELTAPVAHYLPEFGHHGKDDVTVLQLLTMQGGFPQAPLGPDRWGTSEGRRAAFAEWHLDWPAGTRTEYHPVAAHWVIAELLETLDRSPLRRRGPRASRQPGGRVRRARTRGRRRRHRSPSASSASIRATSRCSSPRTAARTWCPSRPSAPSCCCRSTIRARRPRPSPVAAASPVPWTWRASTSTSSTTSVTRCPRLAGRRRRHHPQREHQHHRRRAGQSHHRRLRRRHRRLPPPPVDAGHATGVRPRRRGRPAELGGSGVGHQLLVPPRHAAPGPARRVPPRRRHSTACCWTPSKTDALDDRP